MTPFQRMVVGLLAITILAVWGMLLILVVQPHQQATPVMASMPSEPSATPFPPIPSAVHTVLPIDLPATWTVTPTPLPSATPTGPLPTITPTFTPEPLLIGERPTLVHLAPSYIHPSMTISIPTAVPQQIIPEDAIVILLLGSDQRPDWDNWRTDAIQLLVVHPEMPSAALLSIPRDLYVYVPGFWMSRINFADMYGEQNAFEDGGLGLINQTLLHNLGISADHYVKVDFDGLIGLVDTLGGIEVPVHCRLYDYWPYPDENGQYHQIVLEPGIHTMDGELALWYSRSRKTTSTFSRERRQQQVLEAMWLKAKNSNLLETAPSLYQETMPLFETDLEFGEILSLGYTGSQLDLVNIKWRNISGYDVTPYTTPYGGGVFLPRWDKVQPIVADVLAPPATNRAVQNPVTVEVWNGSNREDLDLLAADRLYRMGYIPIIGQPDRQDYAQTQIVYFNQVTKGTGLSELQWQFRISEAKTVLQAQDNPPATLRLILGADYVTCPRY